MIEGNQLRLGNKFSGAGMVQTVKAIETYNPDQKGYEHLILVVENRNQYKPVDMEPIPLTADLLSSLGFEANDDQTFYKLPFQYHNSGNPCYLSWGTDNHYVEICRSHIAAADVKCNYLHQLQNLYHSLTGKELEIKL